MSDTTSAQAEDKPLIPGTPEYDVAMATKYREAKGETIETPAVEAPKPPEGVPEKFWNPETGQIDTEKLLNSYKELEATKGQKPEDDANRAAENDKATQDIVEKAGLDWNTLVEKVSTNGKIDDADYEALEKTGIPKGLVDDIIEMRVQQFEREQTAAIEYAGGQEAADEMMAWAAENLSEKDKAYYNELLSGPHWRVAVDSLNARRGAASKTAGEPQLASGRSTGSSAAVAYQSKAEMTADMRDPLYFERSPRGEAFRAQVMQKAKLAGARIRQ